MIEDPVYARCRDVERGAVSTRNDVYRRARAPLAVGCHNRAMTRFLPPPVVLVIAAGLMLLTHARLPAAAIQFPGQTLVALIIAGISLLLVAAAAVHFRRAGTTVNPVQPENASQLVATGPYRYSRNPMYVADVGLLLAFAVYLGSPASVLGIAAFIAWIHWLQIRREEEALLTHFGADYARYCERVRRWL